MNNSITNDENGHRLLQFGIALFLIGLLTGFVIPSFANPRMGISCHLQGIMNGMFLILLGLMWGKVRLPKVWLSITFWIVIYGTFANWVATLLAAIWGAGKSMPIAALGNQGSPFQEMIIDALLISLSLAMVFVCVAVLAGLIRNKND